MLDYLTVFKKVVLLYSVSQRLCYSLCNCSRQREKTAVRRYKEEGHWIDRIELVLLGKGYASHNAVALVEK